MKLSLKILIHFIYWSVFVMFTMAISIQKASPEQLAYLKHLTPHFYINLLWAGIIFYIFYGFFIRLFEERRFVLYLIVSVISSVTLTLLLLPVHKIFNPGIIILNARTIALLSTGTFVIAQCGCLVRGFENWFNNLRVKTELENRNLRNELDLLRSQINPHFLFNALNNIDSLIRTNPETASDSLVTLSGMLRYMIYETKSDIVPLDRELEYIKNYLQLQQLRFRNKNYIAVSMPEHCTGIQIAPMILIPYIENAFKYAHNTGKMPVVDISMECTDHTVLFSCKNYFKSEDRKSGLIGGVGLENARRRLELLYPKKHTLLINEKDGIFTVELKIRLE